MQKLRIEEADAAEMDTVKLKEGWSAIPYSLQPFAFSNPLQSTTPLRSAVLCDPLQFF